MRAAIWVLIICTSGCASLGWRLWPKQRSYRYAREVTVEVQSVPTGATIVDADGKPVGTAPFTYRTHHEVERVRRSRSGAGLVTGCVVGMAAASVLFYKWGQGVYVDGEPIGTTHFFDSNRQRGLFAGGFLLGFDCYFRIVFHGLDHYFGAKDMDHAQAGPWATRKDTVRERVIPRAVALEARWLDWAPARASVTIPDHGVLTIRRGHANTFDDALVRHARSGATLTPGGLLRAGKTYHRMASETRDAAHAKTALGYFERYLAGDVLAEQRVVVEALIAELRRMTESR